MAGTCSSCGSALHSDLSRLHGKCGPCRWGDEAQAEPQWRRLVREEERPAWDDEKRGHIEREQ